MPIKQDRNYRFQNIDRCDVCRYSIFDGCQIEGYRLYCLHDNNVEYNNNVSDLGICDLFERRMFNE